jgi:hypothetical protein
VTLLFTFSILIDILWLILIAWRTWFHPTYEKQLPWEHDLHVTSTIIVWVNMGIKALFIALSFFYDPKLKQSFQQSYAQTLKNLQKGNVY